MTSFVIQNVTSMPAMLHISKGPPGGPSNLFGQVAVAAAGGKTVVPTSETYSAYASITMEDGNTYYSSTIALDGGTQSLIAQMLVSGGTFNFEVQKSTGAVLDQITLSSTCRLPVKFFVTAMPVSPLGKPVLSTAVVVNPRDTVPISTAEVYGFKCIVNGITSEPLSTTPVQTNQNQLAIQIYEDTVNFGDWPGYSLRYA
jgi:hypothetical protein